MHTVANHAFLEPCLTIRLLYEIDACTKYLRYVRVLVNGLSFIRIGSRDVQPQRTDIFSSLTSSWPASGHWYLSFDVDSLTVELNNGFDISNLAPNLHDLLFDTRRELPILQLLL